MLKPRRAAVRPRVIAPQSGEALLLEELIQDDMNHPGGDPVVIVGGRGRGKTTAAEHLLSLLPPGAPAVVIDKPIGESQSGWVRDDVLRICTASQSPTWPCRALYRLASWGVDEMLEYLQARRPERARAVLSRLMSDPDLARLEGCPEVLAMVMERMADDVDVVDIRTALRREFAAEVGNDGDARRLLEACLQCARGPWNPTGARVVRHRWPLHLMAAEAVVRSLEEGGLPGANGWEWPEAVIEAVAEASARNPVALNQLRYLVAHGCPEVQPACASILHGMKIGWTPSRWHVPSLIGASLKGAEWPKVNLSGAMLDGADFTGALLRGASLVGASARRARFNGADLSGALLPDIQAESAQFRLADLTDALATGGDFPCGAFDGARFVGAQLGGASFRGASLKDASFDGATLMEAVFVGARLGGTDFRHADLEGARLTSVDLREVALDGARLSRANLERADLENVIADSVRLEGAMLFDATMTGSRFSNADFRSACLRGARLADISWPDADLFYADLREVQFQQGTSRCGLVFSATPCEGSRTGYYGDDFADRDRAPEEIRKANLCGADLRGARLEGSDFYLVDLRGARMTADQEIYLRKCGAILGENILW